MPSSNTCGQKVSEGLDYIAILEAIGDVSVDRLEKPVEVSWASHSPVVAGTRGHHRHSPGLGLFEDVVQKNNKNILHWIKHEQV
jgi:hypothetical protein